MEVWGSREHLWLGAHLRSGGWGAGPEDVGRGKWLR